MHLPQDLKNYPRHQCLKLNLTLTFLFFDTLHTVNEMMDPAAMCQGFTSLGCIGSSAAATMIVDDQGIDSLDELCFLMDADVETL